MNSYRQDLALLDEKNAQLAALVDEQQQLSLKFTGLSKDVSALERNASFLENRLRIMRYNENDIIMMNDRLERSLNHCVERNQEMQERHIIPELVAYFQMDAAMRFRIHIELMAYKKLM
jgi:septal ring factor EnvC (AmiA/AmiB activator)